jgi:hypothetical protein
VGYSPPIVANRHSILLGYLLPSYHDVFTGFVEFPMLFLALSWSTPCSLSLEDVRESLSVMRLTRSQPESTFRRMVEVVIRFFVGFYPVVRNQKAKLIPKREDAI